MDLTSAGFTLLRGAQVYAPQALGIQDVLLVAGKVVAIEPQISADVYPTVRLSICMV